ncbi:MAG: histidine kinase [Arthrospira sp. SH-MAG29]|nr:histidine kinase [Arthrospira sp. SH-MAG29]
MPEYWLDQVYSASAQGSDLLLLDLIEEIPAQYSNLANTMTEWVGSFQFDKVLELVEKTKPEVPNIQ